MKRVIYLFLTMLLAVSCPAQRQAGYVKTPGRMGADGKVVPGRRIAGATLYFRGVSAVVSGGDGTFTFTVPGKSFVLARVQKNDYEPVDHDIFGKSRSLSTEPFIVVMDKPEAILAERLAGERQLRRTMQKQLRKREDELEALKKQHKITEDEYRRKLQELYSAQDNNERLISGMAERYARMDFDQMDDFHRRVATYIQNGELTRADSLLSTKGTMESRAAEIKDMDEAIRANADDLALRRDAYDRSMAMRGKDLEYFGADCYNRSEMCLKNNDIDSAAYYLALRADADTLNAEWQDDAAIFHASRLHDYVRAMHYYERALAVSQALYGEDDPRVVSLRERIAAICEFAKSRGTDKPAENKSNL